jgi:hypothetical protein
MFQSETRFGYIFSESVYTLKWCVVDSTDVVGVEIISIMN